MLTPFWLSRLIDACWLKDFPSVLRSTFTDMEAFTFGWPSLVTVTDDSEVLLAL